MELSRRQDAAAAHGHLSKLRPADLAVAPAIAEYTTASRWGIAEKMARENDISRRAQDEIALLSHQRAAAAAEDGRLTVQIAPTFPPPGYDKAVTRDNGVRADSSMEALGKLKPVFDKRYGSLTAGNSSPLTDGGSAVLLMSEEKAKALGYTPLGYIRSYAFTALNPGDQLLQGPAYAAPAALDAAGVKLADIDWRVHERSRRRSSPNEAFASRSSPRGAGAERAARGVASTASTSPALDRDRPPSGDRRARRHPRLYELRRRDKNPAWSPSALRRRRLRDGGERHTPLKDILVWTSPAPAGPPAAHLLADLGAGDQDRRARAGRSVRRRRRAAARRSRPPSPLGVESVALDLSSRRRRVLARLLTRGVLPRASARHPRASGFPPEELRVRHPRLVVCSVSAGVSPAPTRRGGARPHLSALAGPSLHRANRPCRRGLPT